MAAKTTAKKATGNKTLAWKAFTTKAMSEDTLASEDDRLAAD
tara:strand:- start:291 stop:416 length:126 start_codon:yes stop_codon:yes gene_type:complete